MTRPNWIPQLDSTTEMPHNYICGATAVELYVFIFNSDNAYVKTTRRKNTTE